jgi:hypothetical protein
MGSMQKSHSIGALHFRRILSKKFVGVLQQIDATYFEKAGTILYRIKQIQQQYKGSKKAVILSKNEALLEVSEQITELITSFYPKFQTTTQLASESSINNYQLLLKQLVFYTKIDEAEYKKIIEDLLDKVLADKMQVLSSLNDFLIKSLEHHEYLKQSLSNNQNSSSIEKLKDSIVNKSLYQSPQSTFKFIQNTLGIYDQNTPAEGQQQSTRMQTQNYVGPNVSMQSVDQSRKRKDLNASTTNAYPNVSMQSADQSRKRKDPNANVNPNVQVLNKRAKVNSTNTPQSETPDEIETQIEDMYYDAFEEFVASYDGKSLTEMLPDEDEKFQNAKNNGKKNVAQKQRTVLSYVTSFLQRFGIPNFMQGGTEAEMNGKNDGYNSNTNSQNRIKNKPQKRVEIEEEYPANPAPVNASRNAPGNVDTDVLDDPIDFDKLDDLKDLLVIEALTKFQEYLSNDQVISTLGYNDIGNAIASLANEVDNYKDHIQIPPKGGKSFFKNSVTANAGRNSGKQKRNLQIDLQRSVLQQLKLEH